ncbi:MAG TPA: efflux RND transporter periplasmic adaptor subunit [Thermoanaerobaculia bacterium]|nr:efflux RND transporter periplasmic adaptor subunit [Thermoanaerobaculia bacterium]
MSILSRNHHVILSAAKDLAGAAGHPSPSSRLRMTWPLLAVIAAFGCAHPRETATSAPVSAPTQLVRSAAVPDLRFVSGTVRSNNVSPLAAKVMGNVTRVLVSEGDFVRAGQPLLEIESRDLRARTDQAQAQSGEVDQAIAAAQANADVMAATYRRFAALRERGSVSPQEFDEVTAKNRAAQAQLQQALARRAQVHAAVSEAQTFLGYAIIRAPFDGIVTARMIDAGAQAAPGMPLLTIEDASSYRVESMVDEELASRVKAGDEVVVDGIRAQVTSITPSVDPMTRSALVKINLPHSAKTRSGSFVRVGFGVGTRQAISVPANAVTRHGDLTSIYVVDAGGTARLRLVTLGNERDGNVEVLSGLDDGERIVTTITNAVRDGVRVS